MGLVIISLSLSREAVLVQLLLLLLSEVAATVNSDAVGAVMGCCCRCWLLKMVRKQTGESKKRKKTKTKHMTTKVVR